MRLPRPHIPLEVRLKVALRQMIKADLATSAYLILDQLHGQHAKLAAMLYHLFGDNPYHLDHDPPLMQRKRRRNGKYVPDANDPAHLVYRSKEDHRIKTFVRGDGARRSDMGQRRYLKRVERNRAKRKRKRKMGGSRW